jgi:hypothetical protein
VFNDSSGHGNGNGDGVGGLTERTLNELERQDLLCGLCFDKEKNVEIRPWCVGERMRTRLFCRHPFALP